MRRSFHKLTPSQRRLRYAGRKSIWAAILVAVLAGLVGADKLGLFGGRHGGRWRAAPPFESVQADLAAFDGKSFKVVHVVDGDTLDVEVPGQHAYSQRIRLWGVDTPETVKPSTPVEHFGPEASAFTAKAALDQTVALQLEPASTRDRYGRLLAYVILPDGRMLNRILVQEGFGYADPRFEHRCKKEFEKLQKEAMKGRRGLWKDLKESDLPDYLRGKLDLPSRR